MRNACSWLLLLVPSWSFCCTYCDPGLLKLQTLREEGKDAKFILIGTFQNAKLNGEQGTTDLAIDEVVKDDAARRGQKVITIPRWIKVDEKKPRQALVFFDAYEGKLDAFRAIELKAPGTKEYLQKLLQLDGKDRSKLLLTCVEYLDHENATIATDAFLELAKASDQEIADLGKKVGRQRMISLITDRQVLPERLGLYAYLLGACGKPEDTQLLADLIRRGEQNNPALSGVLGGIIELDAVKGWKLAAAIIDDEKRSYSDKLAVLNTCRFYKSALLEKHRQGILLVMGQIINRGDMADMAIEDLRRWQIWEYAPQVMEQYEKKTHQAPIVQNAIVRYALCANHPGTKDFVARLRKSKPELVTEIEDQLKFEQERRQPK